MRGSSLDALRRSYLGLVRGTVNASSDTPKMQTVDARLMQNELLTGIERFQNYGHISVPRAPDASGGKAAEVIVGFINGNRAHPIVLAVDDRRFRPTGGKPGDVGHYHYLGATATFTDTGYAFSTGPKKLPATWTVGNATLTVSDGKIVANVDGTSITITPGRVDLGGTGGSAVMTADGPSTKVFAVI